jgi:hypothetical protein
MYDGLEIFSATLASEREKIGDRVTRFLIEHPDLVPVKTEIRQSSDSSHHCLTVLLFWKRRG